MSQQKTHFIGIGGAGMSGLAHVMLERGGAVSGSDLAASAATSRLEAMGARIYIGHDERHVRRERPDMVVVSSAVPAHNPELEYARRHGIPVLTRAEMLARLMENRCGIAVAGTHGKTTVTSMIALVLEQGGLDPTVVIGGELNDIGSNAKVGEGPHFVAEADESDRSFLRLSPSIAVVTNVEAEHLENYAGLEDIKAAFRAFLAKLPKDGLAVVCGDDANARAAAPDHCRVVTYGLGEGHDYTAADVELFPMGSRAVVREQGAPLGIMVLRVPGLHNIANALAAVAVGRALNLPFGVIAQALGAFRGAKRRLEVLGEVRDVLIIDDYAHHPTEIRAALTAARRATSAGNEATGLPGRLIACFQPHLYTRTVDFADEFGEVMTLADIAVINDVDGAREDPIPGVTGELVVDAAKRHGAEEVVYVKDKWDLPAALNQIAQPGDLVITLGCGDVTIVGPLLADLLAERPEAGQG